MAAIRGSIPGASAPEGPVTPPDQVRSPRASARGKLAGVQKTIIAVDPTTGRRGLLVEVHPDAAAQGDATPLADRLKRRLFDRSIRVGLVFTPTTTLVVRDLLSTMEFDPNRFEVRSVPTADLLEHAGLGAPRHGDVFFEQVRTWLDAVGSSWYSFLSPKAAPAMVPDVVGHLAQANLESWDGLLERGDAA